MKLDDYHDLETLAAKNAAPMVNAADLLAWRKNLLHARRMYQALVYINAVGPVSTPEWSTQELVDSAPDVLREV